jgi:hypothetical protein
LRRVATAALTLVLLSGCWWWYVAPGPVAMPEGRAVQIAYEYTRAQGLNPTGTRHARYNYRANLWRVNLFLGPPSCGYAHMDINAYNGAVFNYAPFIRPCGGPPPPAEEDRADF